MPRKPRPVALTVVARPAPASPIDSPEAAALAARFHEARRQGARTLVELAVELGQILLEGQRSLDLAFRPWLRERLGLELSTAHNYMAMGRLAREAPAMLERHKDLGASKLYQVARLEAPGRHAVLSTPGIAQLTDRDFKRVVDPHRPRRRKVTPAMRAHGLREKLKSYTTAIGAFKPGKLAGAEAMRAGLLADAKALRKVVDGLIERIERG